MKSFLLCALEISKRSMSYPLANGSPLIHIMLQLGVTVGHSEASVSESALWGQHSVCIKAGSLTRCLIEFLLKPRIYVCLNPSFPGPSTSPPNPCEKYLIGTAKVPQQLWSVMLETKCLLIVLCFCKPGTGCCWKPSSNCASGLSPSCSNRLSQAEKHAPLVKTRFQSQLS